MNLDTADKTTLFDLCWSVIKSGVNGQKMPPPDPALFSETLGVHRSSFVTLTRQKELRGCCGRLEATRPLVVDVASNAWTTAFADPRFEPVEASELPGLTMEVSILSALIPMPEVRDRADLLSRLQPGIDGLVIAQGSRRATFLPKVWDSLPNPEEFVDHLLRKGGFSQWPRQADFHCYRTDVLSNDFPLSGHT